MGEGGGGGREEESVKSRGRTREGGDLRGDVKGRKEKRAGEGAAIWSGLGSDE